MNTGVCIKCGKPNPEHTQRFFAIKVIANSSTSYQGRKQITTTVTNESFVGAERIQVCDECIRKKRLSNSVFTAIGVLFASFLALLILFAWVINGETGKKVSDYFLVIAIIASIIAVIMFFVGMKKEDPFVGELLLKKMKGEEANQICYVPVEPNWYLKSDKSGVDLEVFKKKTGLKTNLADGLFLTCIALGMGDATVDQIVDGNGQQEEINTEQASLS